MSLWFAFITVGFAPVTTGGNSPTGPKLGSGKFANGFIISGIPSSVKGTSINCSFISANTSAACSNGLGNPSFYAFFSKASCTSFEIFNGLNTPSLIAP